MSPYFYVYIKLLLLAYTTGDRISADLLAISLYTPRLAELSMPRRRVDVSRLVGEGARLYLQPLPCSWGALFAPKAWMVRAACCCSDRAVVILRHAITPCAASTWHPMGSFHVAGVPTLHVPPPGRRGIAHSHPKVRD